MKLEQCCKAFLEAFEADNTKFSNEAILLLRIIQLLENIYSNGIIALQDPMNIEG